MKRKRTELFLSEEVIENCNDDILMGINLRTICKGDGETVADWCKEETIVEEDDMGNVYVYTKDESYVDANIELYDFVVVHMDDYFEDKASETIYNLKFYYNGLMYDEIYDDMIELLTQRYTSLVKCSYSIAELECIGEIIDGYDNKNILDNIALVLEDEYRDEIKIDKDGYVYTVIGTLYYNDFIKDIVENEIITLSSVKCSYYSNNWDYDEFVEFLEELERCKVREIKRILRGF